MTIYQYIRERCPYFYHIYSPCHSSSQYEQYNISHKVDLLVEERIKENNTLLMEQLLNTLSEQGLNDKIIEVVNSMDLTSDYNELQNKPSLDGKTIEGDMWQNTISSEKIKELFEGGI